MAAEHGMAGVAPDPALLFDTAIGTCAVQWSATGISGACLPRRSPAELRGRLPQARERAPAAVRRVVRRIQRHLEGCPQDFGDVELDLGGATPFACAVYAAARTVAPGRLTTYGDLAGLVGRPGASRAVGRAMAHNRIPLIVPCHRVVSAGGELGGFSAHGGSTTKLRLLVLEGADLGPIARAGVATLRRRDPRLAAVIRRTAPYPLAERRLPDPFAALIRTITHQQVSMAAGNTIYTRLRRAVGGRVTAAAVLRTPDASLRGAGLSGQKVSYVQDLARRSADGSLRLDRLAQQDDEQVVAALTRVRGIGRWSAEMFLMFRLGRLDVLPVGDLGLQKGAQQVYGLRRLPGSAELERIGEGWRPFRSIGTWYMWRAVEAGGT